MVSVKGLRKIVGISGLALIAFLSGNFYERDLHRKSERRLSSQICQEQGKRIVAEISQAAIYRDYFSRVINNSGKNTSRYVALHKLIKEDNQGLALETLESYILDEIEGTEDFLVSLQNGQWSSNLVKNVEADFQANRTSARNYLHQYWHERGPMNLPSVE